MGTGETTAARGGDKRRSRSKLPRLRVLQRGFLDRFQYVSAGRPLLFVTVLNLVVTLAGAGRFMHNSLFWYQIMTDDVARLTALVVVVTLTLDECV